MAALLDGICTEQGKLRALRQTLLFFAAHLLDALLMCRLSSGGRARSFDDSVAHDTPHLKVGLVRGGRALDVFVVQLLCGERGAESIGGKLAAAHVVENVLAAL